MTIFQAFLAGVRDSSRSKRYIFLVYCINLVIALVFAAALAGTIRDSLGASAAGENMRQGFDGLWYNSFSAQATGLAATFDPSVTGIGALFNGLDAFLSGGIFRGYPAVVGTGIIYLLMWTLFSAGFIALYAAEGERPSFFQQAARFFPRFIVLAALAGILYYLLFHFVFGWLSGAVNALTRETIDERVHFTYTVIKYLILWLLIWIVNMLFDYSKIITVLRNHKNPLTAPFKAVAVVVPHFIRTFGLYLLIGVCWIVLMLLYWIVVPGAGGSTWIALIWAFLLGQIYLFTRIWTRCLFYAGQTALCAALSEGGQE